MCSNDVKVIYQSIQPPTKRMTLYNIKTEKQIQFNGIEKYYYWPKALENLSFLEFYSYFDESFKQKYLIGFVDYRSRNLIYYEISESWWFISFVAFGTGYWNTFPFPICFLTVGAEFNFVLSFCTFNLNLSKWFLCFSSWTALNWLITDI